MSQNRWFRSIPVAVLAAAAIGFAGCGEITKVQECNAVIDTINKNSTAIKDFDSSKDLEEQAKKLEDFEKKIGDVKITDAELKKNVDEYRKMVTDMAKLVRDAKDPAKQDDLEKRHSEIGKTESSLVDKINGYCSRK
jgi:benzoyl-CoA reductase/2-hydroxyglutaryl-CoA dehydratase subunit BcrC/BadD/HgdB